MCAATCLVLRMRRLVWVVAVGLFVWMAGAAAMQQSPAPSGTSRAQVSQDDEAYMCPMHPDVISEMPGFCPRCRMQLVLGHPYDMRDYPVRVRTTPSAARVGEPLRLEIEVFHPSTGEKVTTFTEVHLKRFHLFVLSEDLEFFEHIHPEQDATGTWRIETTLPKPGYYKLLSDFVPFGGAPQFVATPLATEGYSGDLIADGARLTPDRESMKTSGPLNATLSLDPEPFPVATHSHLTFRLSDAETRQPVTDLQTYLGAFGHILIVSEDLQHFVHSHPIDMPPQNEDVEKLLGGPQVIFEALMPAPGRYRAWAQFKYRDQVHTFAFSFDVGTQQR